LQKLFCLSCIGKTISLCCVTHTKKRKPILPNVTEEGLIWKGLLIFKMVVHLITTVL